MKSLITAVFIAAVFVVLNTGASAAATSTLYATVGARAVSVTDPAGRRIVNLRPGTYSVRVADRSRRSGLWLRGPGITRTTSRGFVGRTTWTITLRPGTYSYGSTSTRQTFRIRVA